MHAKTAVGMAIALMGLGGYVCVQAQSKVELWGVVDAAVRHTNNEGPNKGGLTKMIGGGMSQSRWGLNVEEDLGGGSKALVYTEHRFNADSGEKDATVPFFQLSYVGLQGPYGKLTLGRQWNVLFDVVTSTYSSFPYSPYMDAYKPELGMAAGARTNNALKYTLATPDRTWVGTLQYSFAEGNKAESIADGAISAGSTASTAAVAAARPGILAQVGAGAITAAQATQQLGLIGQQAYLNGVTQYAGANADAIRGVAAGALKTMGGFLRYSKNGFSLGGGFLRTELPAGSDLDAWTFGGSYRSGPLYLNMGYGQNKVKYQDYGTTAQGQVRTQVRQLIDNGILNNMWQGQTNGGFSAGDADKRQMVKVGVGYQMTPQINVGMHYFHAKQSGSASGLSNGKANFMVAALDYAFSKRTDAYFAVDHTKVSGGRNLVIDPTNGARTRTGITAGLRHRF